MLLPTVDHANAKQTSSFTSLHRNFAKSERHCPLEAIRAAEAKHVTNATVGEEGKEELFGASRTSLLYHSKISLSLKTPTKAAFSLCLTRGFHCAAHN